MMCALAMLVALAFPDLAATSPKQIASANRQALEMSAKLVRGDLRVGSRATFLVTVRNTALTAQQLGVFKSGGWQISSREGPVVSWFRNTPTHWRCGTGVPIKPGGMTTFEYDIDLRGGAPVGEGILSLDLRYAYSQADDCIEQKLSWSGSVVIIPP